MSEFTDADKSTIRAGVMGAVALVSQASPGFFDVFKESKAAAQALQNAPAGVKEIMQGGMVMPPQASSKEELKTKLLAQLGEAMRVAGQVPAAQVAVRDYVMAAVGQVANASKGVSAEEQALIDEIQQVLQQAPAAAPSAVQQAAPGAPVPPQAPGLTTEG